MLQANVLETKNGLSGFLRLLEGGQEDCIVIARHNKPVAKIVLYEDAGETKRIGAAKAQPLYAEGWDSRELDDEVAELFGVGA